MRVQLHGNGPMPGLHARHGMEVEQAFAGAGIKHLVAKHQMSLVHEPRHALALAHAVVPEHVAGGHINGAQKGRCAVPLVAVLVVEPAIDHAHGGVDDEDALVSNGLGFAVVHARLSKT